MALRRLAALAVFLLAAASVQAQATYTVTFAPTPFAYAIDGTVRQPLTLVRGQTYTFQLSSVPDNHPFYISTSASGGGSGVWSEGVANAMTTGNAAVTFTVPTSAPSQLYYQCGVHSGMGASLTIVSSSSVETPPDGAALALVQASANPVAAGDAARVALVLRDAGTARVTLLDVRGRTVATLWDGPAVPGRTPLEVSTDGLAAGVYRVAAEAGGQTVLLSLSVVR